MGVTNHVQKNNISQPETSPRRMSEGSGPKVTQVFFDNTNTPQLPSHTNTSTWISQQVKDRNEYTRIRNRVKHIAPEMFKAEAKPSGQACEILPQNTAEWKQHKADICGMVSAQKLWEAKTMLARAEAKRNIPKDKRTIKSVFGEDGKVYRDGCGPILARPTIWSAEYGAAGMPQANWPSFAELLWDGDSREGNHNKTRCGRYLPPPRAPALTSVPFKDQPILHQLPLDQVGPIYDNGPYPADVHDCNCEMDNDPDFEERGAMLLGAELVEEIGSKQAPFVPDWQKAQRMQRKAAFQMHLAAQDAEEETSTGVDLATS